MSVNRQEKRNRIKDGVVLHLARPDLVKVRVEGAHERPKPSIEGVLVETRQPASASTAYSRGFHGAREIIESRTSLLKFVG
jgi:Glu-tRNA(Gln) amidotransferase subunit E-like FAD-binding protein